MKFLDLAVACQCHGQRHQRTDQAAVDFLGAVGGRMAVGIEQACPFNPPIRRDGPESDQIRKDRRRCSPAIQRIQMPNLRVAVSIRGVRKLQRDEGLAIRPIESAAIVDERLDEIRADQRWQKLPQNRRLIMPSQVARSGREHLRFGGAFGADSINQCIVRVHEGEVHLRHQHV